MKDIVYVPSLIYTYVLDYSAFNNEHNENEFDVISLELFNN